ncbi:multiprotein-bridging factor 1 family protein [Streptomyces sp. t39]|uniref:helix-turn-helix domain-containing protein n=1 Tax=Streptomyces sp. t39 TaxID=1828156 RepID=UPI0011CE63DC|nr:helix-turn-helix transcriptional regulator [Streptomyces sp. t39]TXS55245.1 XRE family transcriptional regulator [Streptomyces sp. t39]
MPSPDDEHTGARIRRQRKLAHLTQRQLAQRLPYSLSLLNQVECGARRPRPEFVAAVAAALRVDVADLTGPATVTDIQQTRLAALVRPMRECLDLWDLEPEGEHSTPLADLTAEADRLCRAVRATHLRQAASALPTLITALTHRVQTSPSTGAWQALASAYRTTSDVALKLGYPDLATVALDRMGWAAGRASDPCLAAVRQYKRALGHRDGVDAELGRRLVHAGQQLLHGETSREALAVAGQLHLGASAVAARAGDAAAVAEHIAEARALAERVGGEAGEVHWLSFGHINTDLHEMGASLRMRQYDQALTQARAITLPPATLTSRRARYLVDRAVVEMETGHPDTALRHLVDARRAAPEQTRYHPGTREAITGLLHTARRSRDSLTGMAHWVGL